MLGLQRGFRLRGQYVRYPGMPALPISERQQPEGIRSSSRRSHGITFLQIHLQMELSFFCGTLARNELGGINDTSRTIIRRNAAPRPGTRH